MAHYVLDRVKETNSAMGLNSFILTGVVATFSPFFTALRMAAVGDTTWYCAVYSAEWEIGLGTRMDAVTLARTAVISSSNNDQPVAFSGAPTLFSTVPAAKLSAVGPSFSASLIGAQTVTSAVSTKVAFNTKTFDNGGCFNTTNYRFTPNVAGQYLVSWLVTFKSTGALTANTYTPSLWKNGALISNSNYANCASTIGTLGGQALVNMNGSTDYLELFASVTGTGTLTFGGGVGETTLSAYLASLPGPPLLAPVQAPGPSFSAFLNTTNQTVVSGTMTKVAFNAEEFDNGNCFDSVTNRRFMPTIAGYYQFNWSVLAIPTSGGLSQLITAIYKNGSEIKRGTQNAQTTGTIVAINGNGSALIYMNGTSDYVEIYGSAFGTTPYFLAGQTFCCFSGFLASLPTVPVPVTGPAFSVNLASSQAIPNIVFTKITFNSKEFDTNNCFDAVSNNRFQPTVAGYYQINWMALHHSTGVLNDGGASTVLYKNGVAYNNSTYGTAAMADARTVGSCLTYLNGTTDYLEVWAYSGGTGTLTVSSGIAETRFSGHFVRA